MGNNLSCLYTYSSSKPVKLVSLALVGKGYTFGIGSWSEYKYFLLIGEIANNNGADNPKPTAQAK